MVQERWIGLALAISSSLAIGTSFIITKKGLIDAADDNTSSSESYAYLKNPIWWAGMITMVIGEAANFAAYTFAPPILVTPLGALSVLIGAILASIFLNEKLGRLGRIGCALCLLGSLVIILHAPQDKEVETVDEIFAYAVQPAFLLYLVAAGVICVVLIFKVAPKHGNRNPLVYLAICSLAGSVSVMAIKGFGVALKLTLAGNNQLTHPSTYVFGIVVVFCIAVQMNYFNKALDIFSTNVVNPIYYVLFSTSTLLASFLLFKGFNTASGVDDVSLLIGFIIIFLGVYLLNLSRGNPEGDSAGSSVPDSRLPSHSHSRPSRTNPGVLDTGVFPRMSISGNRMSSAQEYPLGYRHRSPASPLSPGGTPAGSRRVSRYGANADANEEETRVLFDEAEEHSGDEETRPLTNNNSNKDTRRGTQQQSSPSLA